MQTTFAMVSWWISHTRQRLRERSRGRRRKLYVSCPYLCVYASLYQTPSHSFTHLILYNTQPKKKKKKSTAPKKSDGKKRSRSESDGLDEKVGSSTTNKEEESEEELPLGYEDSKPASKPEAECIVLDYSDDDKPIVVSCLNLCNMIYLLYDTSHLYLVSSDRKQESSSKPSTSLVNGNELSNVKAKNQLKSDAASSTSLKSDANPGSAMKSDPEYWADVAKFQKETEDLKKEKKETYAEFRDAPDSDDDSESEDMSDEESIPNRSFKRLKRVYEIGDEAHTDDMDLQQSRSDKVQYFSSLNIGDGAFLKRSSGRWEFTRISSKRANIIAFKAGDDGYKFVDTTIESHFDILRKKKI